MTYTLSYGATYLLGQAGLILFKLTKIENKKNKTSKKFGPGKKVELS